MTDLSSSMNEMVTIGCGCAACMDNQGVRYSDYSSDPDVGDTYAPSTAGTKEQFAEWMTNLFWGGGGSYDFVGWGSNTTISFSITNYYSANEKAGIRDAFDTWSEVTNLTFNEVSSGGDISIEGPSGSSEQNRAFAAPETAWNPGSNYTEVIFTGARIVMDYDSGGFGSNPTDYGDYALTTAIHEIGHAIGLGHTGDYNAGNGSPTYDNSAQWTNDTKQYSLMSYWSASNSGSTHYENPSTPMLMDIYAVQSLYGANMSTRTGDTVYGFNSNAGRAQFDFTVNDNPVVAIWDAGGTDTIDLSGFSHTQVINLNDGEFSNVGGSTGNLAIAYGAIIENAIGGSGQDTIYGNEFANSLLGNAGNDTFHGSAGSDNINGGNDSDTIIYSYDISAFLVTLVNATTVAFQHIAELWTDTVIAVENFTFNQTSYTFAELEAFDSLQDIGMRFEYSGGGYNYTSGNTGSVTLTADNIGNSSVSGNVFDLSRTSSALTVNVLNADAASALSFWGSTSGDTINVTGTDSALAITFYAKDGDDYIGIASTITGNDTLGGDGGNDTIYASAGNDRVWGGAGNDILYGGADHDQIWGGTGNDIIYGDNQALSGQAGNDILSGEAGDDIIYGGDGIDTIYGGADNDTLAGDAGNDSIYGGTGLDTIFGNAGDDSINGDDGNDVIYGDNLNRANDVIGHDTLYGMAGSDTIYGGAGDDHIYGDNHSRSGIIGADILYGDAGNDHLYGGDGDDVIHGGDDNDVLAGDGGNDTLNGDAGVDQLWGHSGDDTLNGGDGNDILYGDYLNSNVNDGNDTLNGGNGNDTLAGSGGDDILNGGAGLDQLFGGTGNDTLNGGTGRDILNGGDGIDVVTYLSDASGVTVNLSSYYAIDGSGSYDAIEQIENITGSNYADRLEGNAQGNEIRGENGNDIIFGWAGSDTLYGGLGADSINGGNDSDTIYGGDGNDALAGDAGDDTLYGEEGADQLYGGAGNDILEGGNGNDVLYGDFQNASGIDGNDTLRGGAGNDTLVGRGGNDILEGGEGVDQLWGGSGQDTFVLDISGSTDHILDFSTGENDSLDLSDILAGYYTNPASQSIEDFVRITDSGYNSIVSVDQDGGGNNFVQIAIIYNVTGLTNEAALESSGALITT